MWSTNIFKISSLNVKNILKMHVVVLFNGHNGRHVLILNLYKLYMFYHFDATFHGDFPIFEQTHKHITQMLKEQHIIN